MHLLQELAHFYLDDFAGSARCPNDWWNGQRIDVAREFYVAVQLRRRGHRLADGGNAFDEYKTRRGVKATAQQATSTEHRCQRKTINRRKTLILLFFDLRYARHQLPRRLVELGY